MRSALPTLAVVTLLLLGGCQGLTGPSPPPSDQRAVEAVDRARAASADVTGYRFTVDGQLRVTRDGRTETYPVAGSGTVDVSDRRLNATLEVANVTPGAGDRLTYVEGYTARYECERVGWTRRNLTQSTPWFTYTELGGTLELFERTNVYWAGTERVGGADAAVVTSSPTVEQLGSVPSVTGTEPTNVDYDDVENVTVMAWIHTDTGRVLQLRRVVEFAGGGATAVSSVTVRYAGYGERVDVTRPADAFRGEPRFSC